MRRNRRNRTGPAALFQPVGVLLPGSGRTAGSCPAIKRPWTPGALAIWENEGGAI